MAESDEGIYLPKSGMDRSIGYLIAGIVVLLFFLLTVLGMGRIQYLNDETANTDRYPVEEKSAEIGDMDTVDVVD
jgi:hypothetical protein